MAKRKTPEQFVKDVESKFGSEYTLLSDYVRGDIKIRVRHNKCEYEWDVLAHNFLQGKSKCPRCSGKVPYTTETFKEKIMSVLGADYIVLGDYINIFTKIKMKHLICGCEWSPIPNLVINNNLTCPRCQGKERYSNEDFKKKVAEVTFGEIIPLDHYINNFTKIRFQHLICGAIFEEHPSGIINALKQCPECKCTLSKGEKRIANYLDERKIIYETQYTFKDCFHVNLLRFDFAILENNKLTALIEYDGGQHFKPVNWFGGEEGFKLQQERDQIKNTYCKENNIPLYRIPYWKSDEIESILNKLIHNEEVKIDENYIVI